MRNQIDKIIITAMDRFVWFVLLIVMSHLVTEFTRVTGYARGNRNDVIIVNDSLVSPMQVQNLVLYPGQDYGLYEPNNNNNNKVQMNAPIIAATSEHQGMSFSFRPIIDSIFEIPISTLRAVNSLVARLTGSYQQPTTGVQQKSTSRGFQTVSSAADPISRRDNEKLSLARKSLLRELSA